MKMSIIKLVKVKLMCNWLDIKFGVFWIEIGVEEWFSRGKNVEKLHNPCLGKTHGFAPHMHEQCVFLYFAESVFFEKHNHTPKVHDRAFFLVMSNLIFMLLKCTQGVCLGHKPQNLINRSIIWMYKSN